MPVLKMCAVLLTADRREAIVMKKSKKATFFMICFVMVALAFIDGILGVFLPQIKPELGIRHGEKAGEDTSAEAHLQHCFFPLCSGCRRIPFQRYRHAQLVCQLRGHLISYEYCQGLLCLFSVFYFFCTGKRVPRPVHQTSWRIQDCFSSVVRSLFLVFAWPSLAANRPIPHCSLRFLSFCNIPYHTC